MERREGKYGYGKEEKRREETALKMVNVRSGEAGNAKEKEREKKDMERLKKWGKECKGKGQKERS